MKRKIFFLTFLFITFFTIFIQKTVQASSIDSCQISNDHGSIKVDVTVNPVNTDDNKIYLFAQNVYDQNLLNPALSAAYGKNQTKYTFYVPFLDGTLLYKRYIVAVRQSGKFVPVTDYKYITNPETMAKYKSPKLVAKTKKGTSATTAGLLDLNCDNGFLNIMYEELIGGFESGNKASGENAIFYNGCTYYINWDKLHQLDDTIGNMTKNNIVVTASLNAASKKTGYGQFLASPTATATSGVEHYGFNTENDVGQNMVIALTLFLANRYSNASSHGVISNYLIGNEVNDEYRYYNIGAKSFADFTERYMRTYRVMYNAIRSTNSTSDVYMTLSNFWYIDEEFVRNTSSNKTDAFPCKLFLDKFNDLAKRQGNFYWGVAFHPYSYPLNEASVYDDNELTYIDRYNQKQHYVSNNEKSFMLTMKNIEVLTQYMNKSQFLTPASQVRSIILTEQGYMSTTQNRKDELTQAASIVYAYYKAEALKDIDQFILFRYRDDAAIANEPYGLLNVNGTKKYSYNVYKNLNAANSLAYTNFALKVFGISSWNDILPSPTGSGKFTDYITNNISSRTTGKFIKVSSLPANTLIGTAYMDSNWNKTYNMLTMSQYNYNPAGNANYTSKNNTNLSETEGRNSNNWAITSNGATIGEYKILTKQFNTPVDVSSQPYFGFVFEIDRDIDYYNATGKVAPTKANLIVRLYSTKGDVYEATTNVDVGNTFFSKPYNLYMNLSNWKGKSSISRMEVSVLETNNTSSPMVAEISILKINKAASVSGTELPTIDTAKTDISSAGISAIGDKAFTGSKITPDFTVTYGGKTLTPNVDYVYTFENNKYPGKATLTVAGIGNYTGAVGKSFNILAHKVTITFDSNGFGNSSIASKTVTYGQKYGDLATINNATMSFLGWFTAKSGGDRITASSIVDLEKNTTLYAHYYAPLSNNGSTIAYGDSKALNYSAVFNPEEYWEKNPDVKADAYFGKSYDNAFIHFLNYGMKEGREGSSKFNVVKYAYCLLNDDLRRAFGGNMTQYYIHYLRYGQHEGRSKSDWDSIFDADFYLASNPDVKTYLIKRYTSDGNLKGWCLWHYCEFGANEGRLANSQFSVLNYASANPDIFRAYTKYSGNTIKTDFKAIAVQYLQFGKKEKRKIVNGKYNMNNLPTLRPDVVKVLGINNLPSWVDWYINCGSKGM